MASCECCKTEFSWSGLLRRNFLYAELECKNCGCVHKITWPSRFAVTSLSVVPMLIFGLTLTPFENTLTTMGIGLIVFTLGMLITPVAVNYKFVRK
ncbi:hypothetical protein LCM20_09425 [Halobacillus litoralis]|uniref:TIGR04104 family putative zinc finger protein n=1 Tax=Halobacillus litoralis TaxID=45668 RepID=UPI001CD2CB14|nr:TIGR04104 family putative zinc finger protein [Halobacillus litoralis]MCA0970809.1 hypothetical protein [Halobacillus litoralis]